MTRTLLTVAGVAACLAGSAPGPAAARAAGGGAGGTGSTTTRGRWLVDARGRVLLLHGLNVVAKRPPYTPASLGFGADDAAFLEAHGFDAVRLGVIYTAVEPRPGVYGERYLRSIARTVALLHAHGIRALLDFHQDQYNEAFLGQGFPGWAVKDDGAPNSRLGFPAGYVGNPALQHALDNFFANARGPGGVGLEDRYAAAWRHVARRFARMPGVLGYDLMNEPLPGAQSVACISARGCAGFERGRLARFYTRVLRAIRTVDRTTPVFYEPIPALGRATHSPRLADPHAVYGWHMYVAAKAQSAQFVLARGHSAGREPQMLTEFGSTTDTGVIRSAAALADRALEGWTEWTYVSNGITDNPGTPSLVRDPRRAAAGANVDRAQLAALVRPHAEAVAGVPVAMRYDPRTGGFTFRYRPGSGPSASTRLLVPRAAYPGGHRTSVRGGAVARDRAGVVDVRARGRGTVTVTVRRATHS